MRQTSTRIRRIIISILSLPLIFSLISLAPPAHSAPGDDLNIGFGGSLIGTDDYTSQGDEQKRGVLRRLDGGEEQIPGEGVVLSGGAEGLLFAPSTSILQSGDDGTQSFVMEVEFTAASYDNMATILSAGGNLSVRAQNGSLHYGYSGRNSVGWSNYYKDVALPDNAGPHVLSVHYRYSSQGTTMDVMLDGDVLPSITGILPVRNADTDQFAFGNEIHPQGRNRGITGTIHRIRLAHTDGTGQPFEFQTIPTSSELLNVNFDGTVNNSSYIAATDEVVNGQFSMASGTSTSNGISTTTGGTQALIFTPETEALTSVKLDQAFVAEFEFTAQSSQGPLATLFALGGNLFVRYQGDGIRYGFSSESGGRWSDHVNTIPLPAVGESHIISLAYLPNSQAGASMQLVIDGTAAPTITASGLTNQSNPGVAAFGNDVNKQAINRGFNGSFDRVRLALIEDESSDSIFVFQKPEEQPHQCKAIDLEPANYYSLDRTECPEDILAKASAIRPTEGQLDWQELQYTAFVHFGPNTFENVEWGNGTFPAERVNPTDADIDSWVKTLRDAGMRMAILTVKHHDGFVSYPSRYTDYSIAASPWMNGNGDIVRAFTDAAHKYGMGVGLYLSPADSNAEIRGLYANGSQKSERTIPTLVENDDRTHKVQSGVLPSFTYEATDYGEYFLNQLYEVLTQYGPVDEVWFDGAAGNTSGTERFDYVAYYDLIHKLQPQAQVAVGGRDIRWVGTEAGIARNDEWAVVPIRENESGGKINVVQSGSFDQTYGSDEQLTSAAQTGLANQVHWWPSEADMKLTPGWFWGPAKDAPKSPETLLNDHWDQSVGRNAVLLLNVPPTTEGRLSESNTRAIMDFAALRRRAFGNDLALGLIAHIGDRTTTAITDGNSRSSWAAMSADDQTPIEIDLGSARRVDRIGLSEDTLDYGQQVNGFFVEAMIDGEWQEVANAKTIGVSRILRLEQPVTAQKFRIRIQEARGQYAIANVSLWQTLDSDPGLPDEIWINCEANVAGSGTKSNPLNSLEQLRTMDLAPSAKVHFKSGTACDASTAKLWSYGTAENPVIIDTYDGNVVPTIGGNSASNWFAAYDVAQHLDLFTEEYPTDPSVPEEPSNPEYTLIAKAAPKAPIRREANAWGTAAPGAEVHTQVLVNGKWSTSQTRTATSTGWYVIPLTYGWDVRGTYTWRVVTRAANGEWVISKPMTQRRVTYPTASSAGSKAINQNSYAWGTVDNDGATEVWTEVYVAGKGWSRSQTRNSDHNGYFVIPLTYGWDVPGQYQYRIAAYYDGIGTLRSQTFTFRRY